MKLHKRRLAGLLLTCALLLGLLPAAALAVDLGDLQNVTLSADGVLSWDRLGDCHNYQLQIHAPDGQQILIGHISGSGNDVHYS